VGLGGSGFASTGSLVVTPKKLATASQELLSLDFSTFGFSSASSSVKSSVVTWLAGGSTAAGSSGEGADFVGTAGSDLGFCGAREGVPSKLASEFQWSDIECESPKKNGVCKGLATLAADRSSIPPIAISGNAPDYFHGFVYLSYDTPPPD
jgi:hypothetical protein